MRRSILLLLLLSVASLSAPAVAQPVPEKPAPAPEPAPAPADPFADQVQGTCRTPREAMLQLLYWIQPTKARIDPNKAAACFDTSQLGAATVATRAELLKQTLDVRGMYIDVDAIPNEADYKTAAGIHRWRLPELEAVEIVKLGSKWMFSTATIKAIPALHDATQPSLRERIMNALPDWAHKQLLGIEVWQLVALLLIVLVALALQRIVVFIISTYVRRVTSKLGWVEKAITRIARPVGGLVMAAVFYLFGPWLRLSDQADRVIATATVAVAAYSAAWLAYRLVDVLTDWLEVKAESTDSKLDDQLVPLLRKTLKVFIAIVGALFVLQNLEVDVGSLLAGLGLGGLAFALAAKDSVANFFGSLVVFVDKPFQIGDWVVIAGVEGTVEEVGFRTTRVRTFYNSLVTIPNAKMTDTSIDNYGARRWRRYVANMGLQYDTPPERVEAYLEGVRKIIDRLPGMRKDFYAVEFNQYNDSSLNVIVYCFMDAPDWSTEMKTRTQLNLEMLKLAQDLGIGYAFPTRTLHIETQATATDRPSPSPLDQTQLADIVRRYGPREEPTPNAPPE